MRIIDKTTGETAATILTNHSWTLDEAIEFAGEFLDDGSEDNVLIDGRRYYYDDLDLAFKD